MGRLVDHLGPADLVSERQRARRARATALLVSTLGRLKGPFAKAGQFASLRHDLLPPEVSRALAPLRDRVPPVPFQQIQRAVEEELGAPLGQLFRSFDPDPLGAASIAQVHRARMPDGTAVAVKVQYPWIAAALPRDLAVARAALALWLWWKGRADLDLDQLFAEFRAGLVEELNFDSEAAAAAQIAQNLAGDSQVMVPTIEPSHSTSRVLTMRFVDCIRIDDRAALDRLGVAPAQVLEVVARAYAKQVFADGLFHADPHPGNLFVIDEPSAAAKPRVLFVDFGLCKRLTPQLRGQLRRGVYAILQRDAEALLEAIGEMGMIGPGAEAGIRDAVTSMFEQIAQKAGSSGVLGVGASSTMLSLKDEAKTLLQETPGLQLPNDLLLYAKTLATLFALGEELDPDVDLMKISLPYLLQFLAGRD